ncbi:hypothetical protein [Flavobacterium sp. MK4S-17]|uniref:hypothetical protein n=1 Tax=Flavobacterium sp. MK4S-17 TaxID=2543737 RepID=UPI00135A5502|nr:hypothetical protein [Flavobacterium sp. MK4S-17]
MKQTVTKILTFSIVLLLFVSCQNDDLNEISETTREAKNTETYVNLDFLKTQKLEIYNIIKNYKLTGEPLNNKSVYNTKYKFTIDTDRVLMINANGIVNYTFRIIEDNNNNNVVKNLVLRSNVEGSYDATLVKYNFTQEDIEKVQNGEIINDIEQKTEFENLPGFDPEQLTLKTIYIHWSCSYVREAYYYYPDNGDLVGGYNPVEVRYKWTAVNCSVVSYIDTEAPGDGSGGGGSIGGGGGGGISPGGGGGGGTNPNPNPITTGPQLELSPQLNFFMGLEQDQKDFLNTNTPIKDDVFNYIKQNHTDADKNFALQAIDQMMKTGLKFDMIRSNSSPGNIDLTAVQGNTVEEIKFRDIYDKLLQSDKYKNLFVNLFGNNDVHNIKFKIGAVQANDPYVNATSQLTKTPESMYNEITITRSHLNDASNVSIAVTIVHELIHAFLNVKMRYPDAGPQFGLDVINGMTFVEAANTHYGGLVGQNNQHNFFVDYMIPTLADIISPLKDKLLTPLQINRVEHPELHENYFLNEPMLKDDNTYGPSDIIEAFNWDDYFNYISMVGLQHCTAFNSLYPENSKERYYFLNYIRLDAMALKN